MIPRAHITEWSNNVPWQTNEQVEQDLILSRALVEIFNDEFLAQHLAFRGGTALHKLFYQPQPRYSEDIDLVQIKAEPIKETIKRFQEKLAFIGPSSVEQKRHNNTLKFKFTSEIEPVQNLKIKVEINCKEHFTVLGLDKKKFQVNSEWYKGECDITTYKLEELIGTKLRALYQRRKGRDLFDLYIALTKGNPNREEIIKCFKEYMQFSAGKIPTQKEFLLNMDEKMKNDEFIGDIAAIIRPDEKEKYNQENAYELIKKELIEKI
jgi:predicted nucleotidyltransferase component of viral defense system